MTTLVLDRRNLLAAGSSVLATGVSGLLLPANAQGVAPTRAMSGGSNNYRKGAAIVERIGKGGFWMSGTVRRAGDGAPLAGQRIQIWGTRPKAGARPASHGATLTDKNGVFRLEMPQIIPIFGQPHGHLAYDSGEFKTVFLRPVMRSAKITAWKRTSSFSRSDQVGNRTKIGPGDPDRSSLQSPFSYRSLSRRQAI